MCSFQSKGNYLAQNILWLSRCIENQHGYIQLLVSPSGVETHTAININVRAFLDLSSSVPSKLSSNEEEHKGAHFNRQSKAKLRELLGKKDIPESFRDFSRLCLPRLCFIDMFKCSTPTKLLLGNESVKNNNA